MSRPASAPDARERAPTDVLTRACERTLFEDPEDPPPVVGPGSVDWSAVRRTAECHHVSPLLASGVENLGDGGGDEAAAVPAETRRRLAAARRRVARAGLLYASVLQDLVAAFDRAGVRVLAYKGPVLAARAYGAATARPYVDVDLLVPESEYAAAERVLREAGFERVRRLHGLGEADFVDDDGVVVDLHHAAVPRYFGFEAGFEALWDRRVEVPVAGESVPALSPVDALLVVCVHGGKHLWYRLGWTCDVAALLTSNDLSPGEACRRADRVRCRRALAVGVALAERCFETPVAPGFADRLDADGVGDLAAAMDRRRRGPDPEDPSLARRVPAHWRLHDRHRDRLRYLYRLGTIPSADDRAAVPVPDRLDGLYRVVRPARLGWRLGRRLVG